MESHQPDGVPVTFSSGGQVYQKLFSGYTDDGGHLNAAGRVRIATGWYAVASQLAAALPGDLDGDHDRDAADLAVQLGCFGPSACGDMDGDGNTSGADVLALLDLLFG